MAAVDTAAVVAVVVGGGAAGAAVAAVAASVADTETPAVSRRSDGDGSDFAAAGRATTDDGRPRWPDRTDGWTV